MIFAEGGVTNGINLSRFRRGAFQGLKAVNPSHIKYNWQRVNPDGSSNVGLELFPLIISEMGLRTIEINHYPTFVPNDYLFNEYSKTIEGGDKMEKWEIYASAVNDFIRKEGNMGVNEMPSKYLKLNKEFIHGKVDEIEING